MSSPVVDAPPESFFSPDSVTWRLHADPSFTAGGFRALILQALHPLAMAAVAQIGGFEDDFWGRLGRTTEYVVTVTYGTTAQALRAGARIRGIHRKLRPTDPVTGETFRVDRPDLLLWVHCCQVDSLLSTARRAGLSLTDVEADQYVAEQIRVAELAGIEAAAAPHTVRELADYFTAVRPELRLTADAQAALRGLASPPMATWVRLLTPARPAWQGLAALGIGLLPSWARRMYRLPGLGLTDLAATGAVRTLRTGLLVVPDKWREGPAIRAAKERLSA